MTPTERHQTSGTFTAEAQADARFAAYADLQVRAVPPSPQAQECRELLAEDPRTLRALFDIGGAFPAVRCPARLARVAGRVGRSGCPADRCRPARPGDLMTRLRTALTVRWRRVAQIPDAGSTTAEMALLTPLLVMLLLFVVLCGRLAGAQIDVDAAASSAARSGSIARSQGAATADAELTARDNLAARGVTCESTDISVSTGGLQPGGAVTVTVSCRVRLSDLTLLSIPGSRVVRASATSPIDQWTGGAS